MCGIIGFSGKFRRSFIEAGLGDTAHRGPDDSGIYHNEAAGIGLGHARLSIIDLSPMGHQPMWDAGNQVAIVFNGEIYNYRELRFDLVKAGFTFKGGTDTEVLLNLYLAEGEEMLKKLNGIFAFAIWDPRNRSLFLARDGLGTKPLYYARVGSGFLFASEIKALLREPTLERSLNSVALAMHLTYLWCPSPQTMMRGVEKLSPGHALIVHEGCIVREWAYYDLPNGRARRWSGSEAEAIQAVHAGVSVAVSRQMVADVPVGAFLSGGLDSSSIAAFARCHAAGRLQCFTIALEGNISGEGTVDDLPYAKKVAAHLDVDLHTIKVGPEMARELETMLWHLDEPQADPAPLNALFISRLAREHGVKVLLSGAGGDDIFTGYRRHYALAQERYWAWLPHSLRSAMATSGRAIPAGTPFGRRLGKAFQYAGLDSTERLVSYFFWLDPKEAIGLLHPDLRPNVTVADIVAPLKEATQRLPTEATPQERMLYLEGKFFLSDHNLNYTDKMSMAAGVEVRVPLLDTDLVALAASFPDSYRQRGKIGKWIFKKAMETELPYDVVYRPKTGFGAPLRRWLKYELKPLVDDVLSTGSLDRRGIFDPTAVQGLVERDRAGRIDASYTIFALICIELWCRLFIDRGPR